MLEMLNGLVNLNFTFQKLIEGAKISKNYTFCYLTGKIILSDKESDSHWQQNDYKGFCPSVDWDTVDFKSSLAIQELPVISAICDPLEGQKVNLQNGKLIVNGKNLPYFFILFISIFFLIF